MTLLEEEPQQKPPPSSSTTPPPAAADDNNHSNTTNTDTNANTNGGGSGVQGQQQQQQQRQTSVDGGDDGHCKTTPRLPRWTRHEILVLIQGKRVVETQVRKARTSASASASAEPKWVSISSYCKRHGVNREPVQCRKRWSNLAGDYRKIKEWESQIKEDAATADSFWIMRNDLRRERKLPGFFDREIFDVLDDRATTTTTTVTPTATSAATDKEGDLALGLSVDVDVDVDVDDEDEEDEAVFDSGRTAAAADDGLFSDFEQQSKQEDGLFSDFEQQSKQEDHNTGETPITVSPNTTTPIPAPLPISERRYQPLYKAFFDRGRSNVKQPASNPEKGSPSQEGQKRRRLSSDDGGDSSLQEQLVKVMESNNKMLAAQLEAQNVNCHLDRDQRKDQGDSLIAVLNKLADALGRIADKI